MADIAHNFMDIMARLASTEASLQSVAELFEKGELVPKTECGAFSNKEGDVIVETFLSNGDCSVLMGRFKAGAIYTEHCHVNSFELLICTNREGRCLLKTPTEAVILTYGKHRIIDKNVPHALYAEKDTDIVAICIPEESDFKKYLKGNDNVQ